MLLGTKAKHYFENFKKQRSKKRNALNKVKVSGTSTAIVEKVKKDLEPYLFFTWYCDFTRPRASKANIAVDGLSDCESDSTKDIDEEEKNEGILQVGFMEASETTENEHAVMKTVTPVTKDKHKNNFRKRPPFKGGLKAYTESIKAMEFDIKKGREFQSTRC